MHAKLIITTLHNMARNIFTPAYIKSEGYFYPIGSWMFLRKQQKRYHEKPEMK